MIGRIGRFLYSTAQSVFSEDFLGLSAEMAFYTIFSFFPFLIFVVSLFSIFVSASFVQSILMMRKEHPLFGEDSWVCLQDRNGIPLDIHNLSEGMRDFSFVTQTMGKTYLCLDTNNVLFINNSFILTIFRIG